MILVRVRLRPSYFDEIAKTNILFISSCCAKPDAEVVLGPLFDGLFDSSVVQLGFMENSKKRRPLLSGAATSAHLSARLWTQASKPALTDSSLAMKIPV